MRIKIELELDGSSKDVAILRAITRAIADAPPPGLDISDSNDLGKEMTNVTVWSTPEKAAEAVENMAVAPEVKVETQPIPPAPTPPVEQAVAQTEGNPADEAEQRKRMRQLLLDASMLPGVTTEDARNIALRAAGVTSGKGWDVSKYPVAIKALEDFIAQQSSKA